MRAVATVALPSAKPEWFASWFDSAHYHRLYSHRDQAEARAFVDRLIDRLEPARGASMLDLGCGSGRHARCLAARGFRVTGLDLSAGSLARARSNRGPEVRYLEQDMRQPFGTNAFDFVFSLFTSFGYFGDPGDHSVVIGNIAAALTGGGRLVLDYLNARHVEQHLVASEQVSRGEVIYQLTRWSTAQAFFKRIEIHDGTLPAPLEYVERVATLTLGDFQRLFEERGLVIEQAYGDYQLAPFDAIESPRLILVAARRSTRDRSAPRQAFADATQRLGGDAEIRGQHGLRNAPDDRGIRREELQVSLLGGGTERADDPLILRRRVLLEAGAKCGAIGGNIVDQPLVRGRVDQQQLGVFDRVDEVLRGRAGVEAVGVGEPPRLGRELNDVFLALGVDDVVAQAARRDEGGVGGDVAAPLQELALSQPLVDERPADNREIVLSEGGPLREVRAQHIER
jgi:SAM-dependent methyltransferase